MHITIFLSIILLFASDMFWFCAYIMVFDPVSVLLIGYKDREIDVFRYKTP